MKQNYYLYLFLFFALVLSARMLHFPFLFDDTELWLFNSRQADFSDMLATFVPKGGKVLLAEIFYRPLTHLSWWVDGMLWVDWVPGYRISNFLFHLTGAWIAGLVVLKMGGDQLARNLTMLFFLLHPGHLEAVGWVAARGDLLVTIFMGLGLLAYLQLEGRKRLIAVMLAFLGSLFCKEAGLVFPGWIIMTSLLIKQDFKEKDTWILYASLIAMALAYLGTRYIFFGGLGGYKVAEGSGTSYVDILLNGDLFDRARTALGMLLTPWPKLAAAASRYAFFHGLLYLFIVLPILVYAFKTKKKGLLLLFWFLTVSMGSYFPSSVIDPGGGLQNSRLIYSGSLSAMVLLGIALSHLAQHMPRLATPLIFSGLLTWTLTCGLAQSSWMKVGHILETLPKELKANFPYLKTTDDVLFINNDLLRREGVRLFSSTPSAFARAMHPGYGIENIPQADWNHPASAHRFQPAYWQENQERLGKDLFYVRWDETRHLIEDMTEVVRAELGKDTNKQLTPVLELNTQMLHDSLLDKSGLAFEIDAANQVLKLQPERHAWIAFNIEATHAKRIKITWRSQKKSETAPWAVFWTSKENPSWGAPQVIRTQVVLAKNEQNTITEIKLPHPLGTQPVLTAFRIDPPTNLGEVQILSVQFLK